MVQCTWYIVRGTHCRGVHLGGPTYILGVPRTFFESEVVKKNSGPENVHA